MSGTSDASQALLATAARAMLLGSREWSAEQLQAMSDGEVIELIIRGIQPNQAPQEAQDPYVEPPDLKQAKPETHRRALLPERYPQSDLFICDVIDASVKDITGQMEHPIYSLSKKPDLAIRKYEHNGVQLEVTPSVKGIATIYDKDILIYAISQLMAKMNADIPPHRTIRMKAYDLLVSTNRGVSGREYNQLEEAFERLAGTRLKTDVRTNDERTRHGFGLIESWKIIERRSDERMDWVEVTLSDWMYRAVLAEEVLTLHRDYFRLGSPIDRRLYELARKHCGLQQEWRIGLALLQKKTGSRSSLREFREAIRERSESDHIPEYRVCLDEEADQVIFRRRRPEDVRVEEGDAAEPDVDT